MSRAALLFSAVCLAATVSSAAAAFVPAPDCPPQSADFDGDGVADTLHVATQPWSAAILSGADAHSLYSITLNQDGAHFSGAMGALPLQGNPAPVPHLIAGLASTWALPNGGL